MSGKSDNGHLALRAKVEMRTRVLAVLPEAKVFDACCGETQQMYRAVWCKAREYVGCDIKWSRTSETRRYVGDAALVMRAIDLSEFNVFDLDVYGAPWDLALILAARRQWDVGERGAVVFTDGGDMKLKFGTLRSLDRLVGGGSTSQTRSAQQASAVGAWCRRAGVTAEHVWQAKGFSSDRGAQHMRYTAVVFRGAGESSSRDSASRRDARSPGLA